MNIVSPSFEVITPIDGMEILKTLEAVGRTCYKSEDKITDDSCIKFVKGIKNVVFGGEGLFNVELTGPGHVWLQTMPLEKTVELLRPYFPSSSDRR